MTSNKLLLLILAVIVIAAAAFWSSRSDETVEEPTVQHSTTPTDATGDNEAAAPEPVFDERNWVCTLWENSADGTPVCNQWSVRRKAAPEGE